MFLTYQANLNNLEKINFNTCFIHSGRFHNERFPFKLNFTPAWNSTRFVWGWNSRVNRTFFILGRVSSPDDIWSRLHVNTLYYEKHFSWKTIHKCDGKTIPRLFSKNQNWAYLQINSLRINNLLYVRLRAI